MSIYLNADEVFQIGVQIEANGKLFYETAAMQTTEGPIKKLFQELASWENRHINLFENLRLRLPEAAKTEELLDPDSELQTYIMATADSHVFVKNKDILSLVSNLKTPQEVLDLAMAFEKDSVVFFTVMKKAVPEALGKEQIDRLIIEEIKHMAVLTREKEKLEGSGEHR